MDFEFYSPAPLIIIRSSEPIRDCGCSILPNTQLLLAPSPRITAFLARKGLLDVKDMVLAVVEPLADRRNSRQTDPAALDPPPDVVTTPCDPWPRPYYLEDGLRKVHPYHYTYNTYCKERWRGRELLDIFATEFRDRPQAYYVKTPFSH